VYSTLNSLPMQTFWTSIGKQLPTFRREVVPTSSGPHTVREWSLFSFPSTRLQNAIIFFSTSDQITLMTLKNAYLIVGQRDRKVSNFTKTSNENLPIEIRSRTRSGAEIRTDWTTWPTSLCKDRITMDYLCNKWKRSQWGMQYHTERMWRRHRDLLSSPVPQSNRCQVDAILL